MDMQTASLKSCCQFNNISYLKSSSVCAALDSSVEIIIVFIKKELGIFLTESLIESTQDILESST